MILDYLYNDNCLFPNCFSLYEHKHLVHNKQICFNYFKIYKSIIKCILITM